MSRKKSTQDEIAEMITIISYIAMDLDKTLKELPQDPTEFDNRRLKFWDVLLACTRDTLDGIHEKILRLKGERNDFA